MINNIPLRDKKARLIQDVEFVGSPVGDTIEKKYHLFRDEHDNASYVEYGEIDVQAEINSYEKGCSLADLLARCSLMSPKQTIDQCQQMPVGVSVDTTLFPKDMAEVFAILKDVEKVIPDIGLRLANGASVDELVSLVYGRNNKNTDDVKENSENVENQPDDQ